MFSPAPAQPCLSIHLAMRAGAVLHAYIFAAMGGSCFFVRAHQHCATSWETMPASA